MVDWQCASAAGLSELAFCSRSHQPLKKSQHFQQLCHSSLQLQLEIGCHVDHMTCACRHEIQCAAFTTVVQAYKIGCLEQLIVLFAKDFSLQRCLLHSVQLPACFVKMASVAFFQLVLMAVMALTHAHVLNPLPGCSDTGHGFRGAFRKLLPRISPVCPNTNSARAAEPLFLSPYLERNETEEGWFHKSN